MAKKYLNQKELRQIDYAVQHYVNNQHFFDNLANGLFTNLSDDIELKPYIHFMKKRIKDPSHLKDKLVRKALEAKLANKNPNIDKQNVFLKIHDLAGVRILHLHSDQIGEINRIILKLFDDYQYRLVETPKAICWDKDYEEFFRSFGIKPQSRGSMYTSVHYIVEPNRKKLRIRGELQVRTLMDEVWGEVSHQVGYPDEKRLNRVCREQLKVLARLTSGCSRLVDSIFQSQDEA